MVGMIELDSVQLKFIYPISRAIVTFPSEAGPFVGMGGDEDPTLPVNDLNQLLRREIRPEALADPEDQEFSLQPVSGAGSMNFLSIDEAQAVGLGQPPEFIKFGIWPTDAVFGDGDAVQAHLDCSLNKLFRADD